MGPQAVTLICRMSPSWAGQPRRTSPVRVSRSTMKPEEKPATTLRPLGLTAKERTSPGFSPPPSRNSCCRRKEVAFVQVPPIATTHTTAAHPIQAHQACRPDPHTPSPSMPEPHPQGRHCSVPGGVPSECLSRLVPRPPARRICTPPDLQSRLPAVHKAQGGVRAGHGDAGVGSRHDSYSSQGRPAVRRVHCAKGLP